MTTNHHRSLSFPSFLVDPDHRPSMLDPLPSASSTAPFTSEPTYSTSSATASRKSLNQSSTPLQGSRVRSFSSSTSPGFNSVSGPSASSSSNAFGMEDFFGLGLASLPSTRYHWQRYEEDDHPHNDYAPRDPGDSDSDDDVDLMVHLKRRRSRDVLLLTSSTNPGAGQYSPSTPSSQPSWHGEDDDDPSVLSLINSAVAVLSPPASHLKNLALSTLSLSPNVSPSLSLASLSLSSTPALSPSISGAQLPLSSTMPLSEGTSSLLRPSSPLPRWPSSPLAVPSRVMDSTLQPLSPSSDVTSLPSPGSVSSLKSAQSRQGSTDTFISGVGEGEKEAIKEKKVTFALDLVVSEDDDDGGEEEVVEAVGMAKSVSVSWRDWIGV